LLTRVGEWAPGREVGVGQRHAARRVGMAAKKKGTKKKGGRKKGGKKKK
jgi:hypothetical protein